MITLLSAQDRAKVQVEYRLRLLSVGALLCAGVFAATAIALLPSYFSARLAAATAGQEVQLLQQALDNSALASAGKSVRSSQALLSAVALSAQAPRPSAILALIAGARVGGVTITREEYALRNGNIEVRLSGIAATRDGLLRFRQSLGGLPDITSVDLPIDNLAKATDITYAIVVGMRPQPNTP